MKEKFVLVVDDEENQRILYEQELKEEGYTVITASNGKTAIDIVNNNPKIDLVLLDIGMPEMDGLEALGRILAKNPKMPIILNTAYPNYKSNFMSWAAEDYIVKSSDLSGMKKRVKAVLDKFELQK